MLDAMFAAGTTYDFEQAGGVLYLVVRAPNSAVGLWCRVLTLNMARKLTRVCRLGGCTRKRCV